MTEIQNTTLIGYAVSAEWNGITVLLNNDVDVESVRIGSYSIVQGTTGSFLCMVADVRSALDRTLLRGPILERTVAQLTKAGGLVSEMKLKAYLFREHGADVFGPVSSVPGHLRKVNRTDQDTINTVFATEGKGVLPFGTMLDMPDVWISLDLTRLATRSTGIFGMSGTGKSFFARMVLAGVIKEKVAANLIFDMHNEYGWESQQENGTKVKGLAQIFPGGQVSVFTLDGESARRRHAKVDWEVRIGYDKVEPEDIEALQISLDLSDVQVGAVYALARRLGKLWLANFLSDEFVDNYGISTKAATVATMLAGDAGMKALASDSGQPIQTLEALRRKLMRFTKFWFLVDKAGDDVTERIMRYLDAGQSVVLEFGRYGRSLDAYIFVANFLTRRIHQNYVEKMEAAVGANTTKPTPLIITIEEAHKFLDPAIAKSTIFGTIAREMRKYNVTLLVIDQRPSQIDPEVMSQIATRITGRISDVADIAAIMAGVDGADGLRSVLSRLESSRHTLLFGHAVALPVAVNTRDYGPAFYKAMGYVDDSELGAVKAANMRKMRGEESEGFD